MEDDAIMAGITVDEILDELWIHPPDAEWTPKVKTISRAQVREWMKSNDMEVLGLVCSTITERRFSIEPDLDLDDYVGFYQRYYGRCLRESPDGDWSDSRWSAGWDLVNVLSSMARHNSVPASVMDGWKKWLADLYHNGSEEIRTCIVQATLEHLLEQKHFRKFFADWRNDPVLKVAYEEALLWHEGGGSTPLGRPPLI
jgi:hypothetical protein